MLKKFKIILAYIAAVITFIAALIKVLGVSFPLQVTLAACGVLALCAVLFALIEDRRMRLPWDSSQSMADVSLLMSISEGLDSVHRSRPDEENVALEANRLVKKVLDKHAIDFAEYHTWRKKNPNIFTAVVASGNDLVGFFDIFPLRDTTAEKLIAGRLPEKAITIDDILTPDEARQCKYLYVATIMANPNQTTFSPAIAKDITLLQFEEFLSEVYAPAEERTYIAYAYTKEGKTLASRCGFALASLPENNPQKAPLFVLRPGELNGVREKFKGLRKRLSSVRSKRK